MITGGSVGGASAFRTVVGIAVNVAASAYMNIIPPAGEDWVITEIASTQWTGTAPNTTPLADAELMNGTASSTFRASGNGPWHPFQAMVNTTTYLRVRNKHTAVTNMGYSGYRAYPAA